MYKTVAKKTLPCAYDLGTTNNLIATPVWFVQIWSSTGFERVQTFSCVNSADVSVQVIFFSNFVVAYMTMKLAISCMNRPDVSVQVSFLKGFVVT